MRKAFGSLHGAWEVQVTSATWEEETCTSTFSGAYLVVRIFPTLYLRKPTALRVCVALCVGTRTRSTVHVVHT